MKKRKLTRKIFKKPSKSYLFILVLFSIAGIFLFNHFFFGKYPSAKSSGVLGSTDKRVVGILVNGKAWDYKSDFFEFTLPGPVDQPNFYSVPVTIRYSNGSSRIVHLGFQYLK